jgi:hypothetical protein
MKHNKTVESRESNHEEIKSTKELKHPVTKEMLKIKVKNNLSKDEKRA